MNNDLKGYIGFAMKSGNVITGEDSCKKEIKKGAYLVIVAKDASENTQKTFKDKTSFYNVPIRFLGTKDELGSIIGKMSRAVLVVKDRNFAAKIINCIDQEANINN